MTLSPKENAAYADKIGFYDTYVVFVMLGSENKYYHKYDCKNFDKRNFVRLQHQAGRSQWLFSLPHLLRLHLIYRTKHGGTTATGLLFRRVYLFPAYIA